MDLYCKNNIVSIKSIKAMTLNLNQMSGALQNCYDILYYKNDVHKHHTDAVDFASLVF